MAMAGPFDEFRSDAASVAPDVEIATTKSVEAEKSITCLMPQGNDPNDEATQIGAAPKDDAKCPSERAPWIRAALLGAQDGLVSVSSLMIGVDAVSTNSSSVVVSGVAGLVAGACSMAIGEYVSVCSQRDIEKAAIRRHKAELAKGPEAVAGELEKLTSSYASKGISYPLARQVAEELFQKDPIGAQIHEELGLDEDDLPRPMQAAMASAISFIIGAIVPLLSAAFILTSWVRIVVVVCVSTVMFVLFGFASAWLGGAPAIKSTIRTTLGGWAAIGITYGTLRALGALGLQGTGV